MRELSCASPQNKMNLQPAAIRSLIAAGTASAVVALSGWTHAAEIASATVAVDVYPEAPVADRIDPARMLCYISPSQQAWNLVGVYSSHPTFAELWYRSYMARPEERLGTHLQPEWFRNQQRVGAVSARISGEQALRIEFILTPFAHPHGCLIASFADAVNAAHAAAIARQRAAFTAELSGTDEQKKRLFVGDDARSRARRRAEIVQQLENLDRLPSRVLTVASTDSVRRDRK